MSWAVNVTRKSVEVAVTRKSVTVEVGPLPRLKADEDRIAACEAQLAFMVGLRLSASATAWAARCIAVDAAVSIDRLLMMDRLVFTPLERQGLKAHLDGLFLANESFPASIVNLVAPATVASQVTTGASLGFTADRYIQGNGVAYIDTGVVLPGASYMQDSAFALVRQVNDHRVNNNAMLGSGSGKVLIVPGGVDSPGPQLRLRANTSTTDLTVNYESNAVGLYGFIRSASTGFTVMADRDASETITHTSEAPTAGTHVHLMHSGSMFGSGQGFAWAFGGGITTDQWAALVDIINAYGRAVGAYL